MNIDKAIAIAKQLNPAIGPSLDLDRKNLSDVQLQAKLKNFFDSYKKAVEIADAHPGMNYEQIQATIAKNRQAHLNNDFHMVVFVENVLQKKGDLASLALSASRRVVLSDPRIEEYFKTHPGADKVSISKEICDDLQSLLINYFSNMKGADFDTEAIINDLTTKVTIQVSKLLQKVDGAG